MAQQVHRCEFVSFIMTPKNRLLCAALAVALLALPLFAAAICIESPNDEDPDMEISRFRRYLRINTAHPNPNYSAAVSFLRSLAESVPLQTQVLEFVPDKPVLLLIWQGSEPSLPSVMFNSHMDSVPAEPSKWMLDPFSAIRTSEGKIFARGAQDDKCIGIQYIEAIRNLKKKGFMPLRTIIVSYVPDEEIGGLDGAAKFAASKEFGELNVGFVLDEGQASITDEFRVFYADQSPLNLIIKAWGVPGHGSRMYDNSAMENLMKSMEIISKFRESQFDKVKAGLAANSEVISVNPVYMKAGIPSPTGFVMNLQPSEAEAGFDVRLPPTADPDALKIRIADEWAPAIRNMSYQSIAFFLIDSDNRMTHIIEKAPLTDFKGRPLMTSADDSNPWWSTLKKAVEAAGGTLAKPEILPSTTDSRYIRQKGIPALGFSPMINTPILVHEHNEFLKDTVFLKGIEVYESIISSLSSLVEGPHGKQAW